MRETAGLGDLGAKMDGVFLNNRAFQLLGGAYVSSDVSGSEQSPTLGYPGHSLHLPSTDLTIPHVLRQGRILVLLKKRNPIYVKLSDGSELNFTYDEYRRIDGTPELGKTMTVTFQRHADDLTKSYSKIERCIVN